MDSYVSISIVKGVICQSGIVYEFLIQVLTKLRVLILTKDQAFINAAH